MKIVTFHSYRGGNGKTTLAVNFAYRLAELDERVLLIDGDFQAPSIHDLLAGSGYWDIDENKKTFPEYLLQVDVEIRDTIHTVDADGVTFHSIVSGYPKKNKSYLA